METAKKNKKKKFAIFDIDGTIFRSSLLIEVNDELIKRGIFPKKAEKLYEKEYKQWLDRTGTYDEYLAGVIRAFEKYIKGVSYVDFMEASRDVISRHKNRVYRYTRDLVKSLKENGYYMLAISKSPKGIVEEFAKNELGFDKVYGFLYETDEKGNYTGGIMHFELMSDKAKILKRAVEKEGLSMRGSVGVGDTESDVAFLKLVDKPICFNPNRKLYQRARRSGWKIVVERKDVIYEL